MDLQFRREHDPKWNQTDLQIKDWLQQRQEVLLLIYKLSVAKPSSYNVVTHNLLTEFLQKLIDYVSRAHFEIYEKLLAANRDTTDLNLIKNILSKLMLLTHKALKFNDKFETADNYQSLNHALSELSHDMALRFDLEDDLVDLYINNTELAAYR